jgi:hypothetical protein
MTNDTPRVFISHASEDKDRFVVRFAERIRAKGIDAWVDQWEVLPGDSLVDKIFNGGLKLSDVVIVILSNNSIHKSWVQKELNTAVVKNIEDKTRLIPVRLDDCDIPECLRDTLYQGVGNLESYDSEFDRIVSAIYGQYNKPPLGSQPGYTSPEILQMDGLCPNDSLFLEEACRVALEQGHPTIVDPAAFEARLTERGMPKHDILEAQQVLADRYYIETLPTIGPPHLDVFSIRTYGFSLFAEAGGVPEYNEKITTVARMLVERVLVNGAQVTNTTIEDELGFPAMLVEHIFERLQDRGHIKYHTDKGGRLFMYVYSVSPELRRKFEGNR